MEVSGGFGPTRFGWRTLPTEEMGPDGVIYLKRQTEGHRNVTNMTTTYQEAIHDADGLRVIRWGKCIPFRRCTNYKHRHQWNRWTDDEDVCHFCDMKRTKG